MSRTKQINISVPPDQEDVLLKFDDNCRTLGISRSYAVMELMALAVAGDDVVPGAPPPDDVIPEWLL